MQRKKILLWTISFLAVLLGGVYAFKHSWPTGASAAQGQASTEPVTYLNQGWSKADRDTYYWIPQGTVMMSYDIFQNLELAGSQELFRSDANIQSYGLIPSPPDPRAIPMVSQSAWPKKLTTEGRWKGVDVGINCAACHNSELHYQGKRIRIDGGFRIISTSRPFYCADDAMQATLHDSAKFDRLAARLEPRVEKRRANCANASKVKLIVSITTRHHHGSLLTLGARDVWTLINLILNREPP